MLSVLATTILVVPLILALLAAVAPPKAVRLRPVLLPGITAQLAVAAIAAFPDTLTGYLLGGGNPGKELGSEETAALFAPGGGLGLPIEPTLAALITALGAAIAFGRVRGWLFALPWLCLAAAAWATGQAAASSQVIIDANTATSPIRYEQVIEQFKGHWQGMSRLAGTLYFAFLLSWIFVTLKQARESRFGQRALRSMRGVFAAGTGATAAIASVAFFFGFEVAETLSVGSELEPSQALTPQVLQSIAIAVFPLQIIAVCLALVHLVRLRPLPAGAALASAWALRAIAECYAEVQVQLPDVGTLSYFIDTQLGIARAQQHLVYATAISLTLAIGNSLGAGRFTRRRSSRPSTAA